MSPVNATAFLVRTFTKWHGATKGSSVWAEVWGMGFRLPEPVDEPPPPASHTPWHPGCVVTFANRGIGWPLWTQSSRQVHAATAAICDDAPFYRALRAEDEVPDKDRPFPIQPLPLFRVEEIRWGLP
jgi:hypothetical protein